MSRKTARVCLLAAIALAFLSILRYTNEQERLHPHDNSNLNSLKSRRLSSSKTYQPQQLIQSPSNNEHTDDEDTASSEEGYTYLIIHYHKSGHILTQNLRDILLQIDPSIQRNYIDRFPKRQHDPTTKCPHLTLHPNTVYVQSSPDFFCDVDILAEELLTRPTKQRGVKLIHLIRDPFTMAISNYNYHSQDPLPEGENWVKRTNPCAVEDKSTLIYADLFMKTFTSPGAYRLMEYDDFQIIQTMCHRLYDQQQSSPGFYQHLLHLSPTDGLILATTYLMLGHGGDILRMANNIIKLRQLQTLERQIHLQQHTLATFSNESKRKVQVLTMSMDNFIRRPKESTIQFLEFISLGNSGVLLSVEEKEEIATRYEEMYYGKVTAGDEHITSLLSKPKKMMSDGNIMEEEETMVVMSDTVAVLEQSLRENVLWGRVLGNIANLVEESLKGVHNWY
eukprot:scaffold11514_cov150-Skeletonema_marinoi.AAC.2